MGGGEAPDGLDRRGKHKRQVARNTEDFWKRSTKGCVPPLVLLLPLGCMAWHEGDPKA